MKSSGTDARRSGSWIITKKIKQPNLDPIHVNSRVRVKSQIALFGVYL